MKYSRLISIHFQLTNRLFQGNESHGMDLVALNVQRGRDHGLPPYLEWRKICGLPKITSWKQLVSIVDGPQVFFKFNLIYLEKLSILLTFQLVPRLQRLYDRIEDIDVFVGGVVERPSTGSILGPTFQCIVGDQFRRLRLGDRFWYEEPRQSGSFTLCNIIIFHGV